MRGEAGRSTGIPIDRGGAPPSRAASGGASPARVLGAGLAVRRRQCERIAAGVDAVAAAGIDLAERIAGGGRLLVLGAADLLPDARHLALEFLHPVIVGKRAVAAVAVDPSRETCHGDRLGAPGDVVVAIAGDDDAIDTMRALERARTRGLLSVALGPAARCADAADHALDPCAADPRIAKEGRVALYHLLWELTHVRLEASERLAPDAGGAGAAVAALYPFLGTGGSDAQAVGTDLCTSGRAKLSALTVLRDVSVERHAAELGRCGEALCRAHEAGARLFTFGNGGSQTDADWVAGWLADPRRPRPWAAHSLAADPAVLSALANDVGFERVFARQIAALGRPGDVAVGITTSGSSSNVVRGLSEARRRGMLTIGLAGGDGGHLARADETDFLFVVPSDSVHRIQEVQATLVHLLDELAGGPAVQGDARCDS